LYYDISFREAAYKAFQIIYGYEPKFLKRAINQLWKHPLGDPVKDREDLEKMEKFAAESFKFINSEDISIDVSLVNNSTTQEVIDSTVVVQFEGFPNKFIFSAVSPSLVVVEPKKYVSLKLV